MHKQPGIFLRDHRENAVLIFQRHNYKFILHVSFRKENNFTSPSLYVEWTIAAWAIFKEIQSVANSLHVYLCVSICNECVCAFWVYVIACGNEESRGRYWVSCFIHLIPSRVSHWTWSWTVIQVQRASCLSFQHQGQRYVQSSGFLHECWDLNLGHLSFHQAFLSTKPSLCNLTKNTLEYIFEKLKQILCEVRHVV